MIAGIFDFMQERFASVTSAEQRRAVLVELKLRCERAAAQVDELAEARRTLIWMSSKSSEDCATYGCCFACGRPGPAQQNSILMHPRSCPATRYDSIGEKVFLKVDARTHPATLLLEL